LVLRSAYAALALLQVEVSAASSTDMKAWNGWAHSRMRRLVERVQPYVYIRAWPKGMEPPAEPASQEQQPKQQQDASAGAAEGGEATQEGVPATPAAPQPPKYCCLYFMGIRKKAGDDKNSVNLQVGLGCSWLWGIRCLLELVAGEACDRHCHTA
jgi:hypothetical protein